MLFPIEPMVLIWLGLMVVFGVVEAMVPGLVSIWFAAGALVSTILAAFGCPVLFQVFIFLVVSAVCLLLTRPLAEKMKRRNPAAAGAERYIGKRAVVTEQVNNLQHTGRASVLGQDWSIRTENDTDILEVGSMVEVLRISGAKLIVKQIKED